MADRTVRVRLEAITAQFSQKFRGAAAEARASGKEIGESARKSKDEWTTAGIAIGSAGAAIAAGFGLAGKAAIDFESSFAGVRKTVNASEAEFAQLAAGMRSMARSIPTNVNDLNAIGEAAGQLGIQTPNLLGFTRTMADLGETTNLSADEAATSLARLANITQMPQTEFDRLGSTIVALGNNFATTESEIVEMGQRIAGAGAQVGMTEAQIMAISAALSSLGINAEAGGTAISKVMIDIASEVANGGDKLGRFASVAGMSAQQFAAAWQQDAAGALGAFVTGLGEMEQSGGSTLQVLEDLEITEVRMRDALLRASGAGELWAEAGELANRAWDENVALTEEAAQRYETVESRIQLARNAINDAAITIGQSFSPLVGEAADITAGLAGAVADLPGPAATAASAVGGLAGAASLAAGGFLIAAPRIVETKDALKVLARDMPKTVGALRAVTTALTGPWGIALAAGITAIGLFGKAKADAAREVEAFKSTLDDETGAITENTRAHALNRLEQDGLIEAAKTLDVSLQDLTDAALGDEAAWRRVRGQMDETRLAMIGTGDEIVLNTERWADQDDAYRKLLGGMGDVNGALDESQEKWREERENAAAAEGTYLDVAHALRSGLTYEMYNLGAAHGEADEAADGQTGALGELQGAMEETLTPAEQLIEVLDRLIGRHVDARGAHIRMLESFDKIAESVKENGTTLDINTEKGRANLDVIHDSIDSITTLAERRLDEGTSVSEVTDEVLDHIRALGDEMREAKFTEDQIARLNAEYGLTPAEIITTVFAETGQAEDALTQLLAQLTAVTGTKYVRVEGGTAVVPKGVTRHDGGWVTNGMRPPPDIAAMMGLSSDEVPITAQTGELVLSRQQTSAYLSGGMSAGPSSTTRIARQVSGNTIHVHASDADTGLRAASREFDSYERGYV